jgi:hypothetical protein
MIDFSDGWCSRFKARWGLKSHVFHGEAASAPVEQIPDQQHAIRTLLAPWSLHNCFNVDETALNYRFVPERGIASRPLPGLKVDKARLTYVLCTSAMGEKLSPLVIGHAKRPRCFTHGEPSDYGFNYEFNKKAWMKSDIWQQ